MNQSAAVVAQRGLRRGPAGSGQVGREKLGLARGRLGRSVLSDGGAATARHGGTGAPVCRVVDAGAGLRGEEERTRRGAGAESDVRKKESDVREWMRLCRSRQELMGGRLCGVVCGPRERSPALIPRLTAIIRRSWIRVLGAAGTLEWSSELLSLNHKRSFGFLNWHYCRPRLDARGCSPSSHTSFVHP
jgi:hypothetical protein